MFLFLHQIREIVKMLFMVRMLLRNQMDQRFLKHLVSKMKIPKPKMRGALLLSIVIPIYKIEIILKFT